MTWRTSSDREPTGTGSRVETAWRKSSYSGPTGEGACVEVSVRAERVGVRDSKNATGPRLAFGPAAWRAFLAQKTA